MALCGPLLSPEVLPVLPQAGRGGHSGLRSLPGTGQRSRWKPSRSSGFVVLCVPLARCRCSRRGLDRGRSLGQLRPGRASRCPRASGGTNSSILGILKPEIEETEDLDEDWDFEVDLEQKKEEAREQHQLSLRSGRQAGHEPVMLMPIMQWLFPPHCSASENDEISIRAGRAVYDGLYVDCTFGRGGYSREILSRLSQNAQLLAMDIDPTCKGLGRVLEKEDSRFRFLQRPYAELPEALEELGSEAISQQPQGIVFDVGICSVQVDDRSRGFSLQNLDKYPETRMDLRMNSKTGLSAAEWLQEATVEEVAWVLREYGPDYQDSIHAERLAQVIVDDQEENGPFESMSRFAELIGRSLSVGDEPFQHTYAGRAHPARLTLQAFRLFLNCEIEQLQEGMGRAFEVLAMNGRCVITTFKRKEAMVVEHFVCQMEDPDPETVARISKKRRLVELYPLAGTDLDYAVRLLANPLKAAYGEVQQNIRARSGSMYILEKVPRTCPRVKVKPRKLQNRFKQPVSNPISPQDSEEQ